MSVNPPSKINKDDLEKFCLQFSTLLVGKVGSFIKEKERQYGEEMARVLMRQFIAAVIGSALYTKLMERPKDLDQDEMLQHNMDTFASAKADVQSAVAAAFQGALTKYTGQEVEYYCTIKPVPAPINKKPC